MLKSIIGVWIKGKLRDVDFYRNVGAVGALVLMAILYIGMNENLLFLLIGFLKSVSLETLVLHNICILAMGDFFIKLLFKKDIQAMPDYIKAGPVTPRTLNHFIILYNLLNFWNLYLVIVLSTLLYSFTRPFTATLVLMLVYTVSLLNGSFLSVIRQVDNKKKIAFFVGEVGYLLILYLYSKVGLETFEYSFVLIVLNVITLGGLYAYFRKQRKYNEVAGGTFRKRKVAIVSMFSLEYVTIFRSKRLMQEYALVTIYFGIQTFLARDNFSFNIMCYLYLMISTLLLAQYGLGIEANYFGCVWTSPYPLKRLLLNKYYFYILWSFFYLLVLIPLALLRGADLWNLFSMYIYIAGFVNLLMFPICLWAKRLDLNKSSFMNYQGFSFVPLIYGLFLAISSFLLYHYIIGHLEAWMAYLLLIMIGGLGYISRDFFLSGICYLFKKNRHVIMERFRES